jgi:hypothetical protein
MTFILLTGAGFSYNWGGPLASDFFSALLADKGLDDHTRDLLFDSGGAFEKVLADLQVSTDSDDQKRHDALITAVAGIFNGMNNTFMQVPFEFESPPSVQHSMASFLSRFHAIFTLNQDALLELHYNPQIGPPMNWGHLQLPGMKLMQPFQPSGARQDKFAIMEPNPPFTTFGHGAQPYVKLHGSVNWMESNRGKRILIMGGQKAVSIGLYPILTWYHEEFRKMLIRPSAKLMVIGYSFSDTHINDAIVDGIAAGLRLFVIDPFALKALQNDTRIGKARSALIGYSDRSLKTSFGGDRYAHNQVSQFFAP